MSCRKVDPADPSCSMLSGPVCCCADQTIPCSTKQTMHTCDKGEPIKLSFWSLALPSGTSCMMLPCKSIHVCKTSGRQKNIWDVTVLRKSERNHYILWETSQYLWHVWWRIQILQHTLLALFVSNNIELLSVVLLQYLVTVPLLPSINHCPSERASNDQ